MLSYKLTQQKLNCLVNWLLHGYYSYTSMNLVVVIIFSGGADEVLFKYQLPLLQHDKDIITQ